MRQRLLDAGCTPLRGPMNVDGDRWICQVTDPFGAVHGLDGPVEDVEDGPAEAIAWHLADDC